jgi:hypothetical protein
MCDSFALARLVLVGIVRPLVFAASAFIGVSATYVLYILMRRRLSAYRSPLRNIPGPGGARWFKGNFSEVQETDSTRLQEEWVRKYGHVLKYQSFLWVRFSLLVILCPIGSFGPLQSQKLLAVDTVAVSYVLQNSDTFRKSEVLRYMLGVSTGKGMHDSPF